MTRRRVGAFIRAVPLLALLLAMASCATVGSGPGAMTTEERLTLAAIYESKGKTELALREYGKAARQDGSARAWFAMGNIHLMAGRFGEAEASYRSAIRINPSNGAYHNNLAWAYMEQERLDKAESAVSEAIRLDANRRFAYLDTLGAVQIRQGELEKAEATLTEAVRLAPSDDREGRFEIYSRLAELYRLKGDMDRAVRMEERARALGAGAR